MPSGTRFIAGPLLAILKKITTNKKIDRNEFNTKGNEYSRSLSSIQR